MTLGSGRTSDVTTVRLAKFFLTSSFLFVSSVVVASSWAGVMLALVTRSASVAEVSTVRFGVFSASIKRPASGTVTRTAASSAPLGKAQVHRKQKHEDSRENGEQLPCEHAQDSITALFGRQWSESTPTKTKAYRRVFAGVPSAVISTG